MTKENCLDCIQIRHQETDGCLWYCALHVHPNGYGSLHPEIDTLFAPACPKFERSPNTTQARRCADWHAGRSNTN